MDGVVKLLFDILAFSSIMVLVVLGLAVIASMMGIFNLGHGELVLMGAYTVFVFRELGLPVWSGMIVAPFVVAILGAAIEVAFIRRLYAAPVIAMLSTFAIGLIIRETVRVLIVGQYYAIDEPVPGMPLIVPVSEEGQPAGHFLMDAKDWAQRQRDAGVPG